MRLWELIREKLEDEIVHSVKEIYKLQSIPHFQVGSPIQRGYGEYTTMIAFQLSQILGISPLNIAEKIASNLQWRLKDFFIIEVVSPGFINFHMGFSVKIQLMQEMAVGKIRIPSHYHYFRKKCKMDKNFQKVLDEIEYLCFRIQWLLDVFQREGVLPNIKNIKEEHIQFPIEEELICQLILYVGNLQEKGDSLDNKKMKQSLEEICRLFYQYHDRILFRQLQDPHRNFVLSLMLCIKSIFSPYHLKQEKQ